MSLKLNSKQTFKLGKSITEINGIFIETIAISFDDNDENIELSRLIKGKEEERLCDHLFNHQNLVGYLQSKMKSDHLCIECSMIEKLVKPHVRPSSQLRKKTRMIDETSWFKRHEFHVKLVTPEEMKDGYLENIRSFCQDLSLIELGTSLMRKFKSGREYSLAIIEIVDNSNHITAGFALIKNEIKYIDYRQAKINLDKDYKNIVDNEPELWKNVNHLLDDTLYSLDSMGLHDIDEVRDGLTDVLIAMLLIEYDYDKSNAEFIHKNSGVLSEAYLNRGIGERVHEKEQIYVTKLNNFLGINLTSYVTFDKNDRIGFCLYLVDFLLSIYSKFKTNIVELREKRGHIKKYYTWGVFLTLELICVNPSFRNCGVLKGVLRFIRKFVVKQAKKYDTKSAFITLDPANEKLLYMYEHLGFKRSFEEDHDLISSNILETNGKELNIEV